MVKSLFSLDSDDDNADNDVAVMDEVLLQSKGATMVGSKRGKEEEEEE